jgi:hypothetical protein
MGVADLGASRCVVLAGALAGALHEAGVGGELLDAGEAGDVVDLVQEFQG